MGRTIYILEDDADRSREFRLAAAELLTPITIWPTATAMIAGLQDGFERAALISLDHDLNPPPGETADLGTGCDIAEFLAQLIPVCPIIVHTSNGNAGTRMVSLLMDAGWNCERLYPIGGDWISRDWAELVRRMLELGN